jgi:3-oxoacyl-[acyl-carrier protein] reductase
MRLKDKYAIVTGASTGIGRAIAIQLAKQGATVGLIARSIDKLEETKRLVEEAGGKGVIFPADLSNIEQVNELIGDIKQKFGKIDVLINVAGIWHGKDEVYAGKDLENFDQKVILDTYMVGFTSPTLLIHGLLPLLANGKIINISGTFENGAKGWLPYYASKRAIEDLTIGLSEELKDRGIDVNCVSPSDVATAEYIKYFPEDAKNANTPEDIAKKVLEFCTTNQTGQIVIMKQGKEIKEGFHK